MKKSLLIPLGVFFTLVAILGIGFSLDDPHKLPSELIDRPFPEFSLQSVYDPEEILQRSDIVGDIALVNVWATWCVNCLVEHPELTRISIEEKLPLIGVNYNDDRAKAQKWLDRHGDVYRKNLYDNEGKLAIDLGVYGAPETFVVDTQGVIRYRHVGPVSQKVWEQKLKPVVDHLKKGGA